MPPHDKPPGFFVTASDTGVGKTFVAAALARSLVAAGKRVGVYKPVASGCEMRDGRPFSDDAAMLWEAAGKPGDFAQVCPQSFAAALAPSLAARMEGKNVDQQLLRTGLDIWRERSDFLIVEGAGGLLSPLSDDDLNADLARDVGLPLVIVIANRIGAINQALLTLLAAKEYQLPVAGVILNDIAGLADSDDPSRTSNLTELSRLVDVPVEPLSFGAITFSHHAMCRSGQV